jgi:pimeloyl-ACP methyl ester carboxylesterase
MKRLYVAVCLIGLVLMTPRVLKAQVPEGPQAWSDPSPHEIRSVPVAADVELEVLDWGGAGSPLVFLHGMSMNAHVFDDFAPRFTNTHRVIGITRRGHGASSWPDSGYSLPRRVEDIRIVLDSLRLERVTFAGHSLAGGEMTHFASEYPERVEALIYIDAAHDLSLIEQLRLPQICPMGPEVMGAIERRFENVEAFRHTQQRKGDDGSWLPYVLSSAVARIFETESRPDYSSVRAPALAVYHTPRRVEDVLGGVSLPEKCVSAMQRYIYEGIEGFAVGMERGRIVALEDSQHNIHLVSPNALEEAMRRWLVELREGR